MRFRADIKLGDTLPLTRQFHRLSTVESLLLCRAGLPGMPSSKRPQCSVAPMPAGLSGLGTAWPTAPGRIRYI